MSRQSSVVSFSHLCETTECRLCVSADSSSPPRLHLQAPLPVTSTPPFNSNLKSSTGLYASLYDIEEFSPHKLDFEIKETNDIEKERRNVYTLVASPLIIVFD
ncbi:hypothetical protein HAX54_020090 [Datura stramonium]|uniref:Uncharacterized protein n=1 Tax=Datura stramonium TaxID=4076 RepID=A0ABS8S2D9_DATST|nr:hypothetical protein [Datura stramonium]